MKIIFFIGFLLLPLAAQAAVPTEDRPIAVLRALDKITARVETVDAPTERPMRFGNLLVTVRTCKTTPPEETPESAAFIEVVEQKSGEVEKLHFKGWMFASSPALSALEHPLYDIWITGCKANAPEPKEPAKESKKE